MSIHYEIMSNSALQFHQMFSILQQVASFGFKIHKQNQYWRLDSEFGRYILQLENSNHIAILYNANFAKSEQVLSISIEMHRRDKRIHA